MHRYFDFPKLSLDLPELHPDRVESITLDLIERLEHARPFGFVQDLNILQDRRPPRRRSKEADFHRESIITDWI
jgi:hypothetical protein